jgi:3-methyladenine DNA glycosylase AlkC
MNLLEPPPPTSFFESSISIVQPLLPNPSQETIAQMQSFSYLTNGCLTLGH